MRKVLPLVQLQEIDSLLDRSRQRLAVVEAELADRSALAEIEGALAQAHDELQRKQTELRDLELEVQDLRGKLTALEKKLYSGTVMNPKELGAMSDEARQFRGLISTREDRLIELYDEVEQAATKEQNLAARLREAEARHAESQQDLAAEREQLLATIAEQEARRPIAAAEADPQALRTYESIRRTRGGTAVVRVTQRTCQGCRVTLPISEEQRARTGTELVLCQSCGRILHGGL